MKEDLGEFEIKMLKIETGNKIEVLKQTEKIRKNRIKINSRSNRRKKKQQRNLKDKMHGLVILELKQNIKS